MIKNQHLLGGLVVLGAINVLAFLGLISGESASARAIRELTSELGNAREENRQTAETLGRENTDLRHNYDAVITQLREDVESLRERLSRTRKALEAVEERLDKPAARQGEGKEAGQ
jgi:hypothetical protein